MFKNVKYVTHFKVYYFILSKTHTEQYDLFDILFFDFIHFIHFSFLKSLINMLLK